jgi:hypothetical protein
MLLIPAAERRDLALNQKGLWFSWCAVRKRLLPVKARLLPRYRRARRTG